MIESGGISGALRDRLGVLSALDVELLDFPIFELNFAGVILVANTAARNFLAQGAHIIGKNFFSEVCPWAHSPLFWGRVVSGLRRLQLNDTFPYVIRRENKLTMVEVHAVLDLPTRRLWVIMNAMR